MSAEKVVYVAFEVYKFILIARIILSFIRHNPHNPVVKFIYELSEPFLAIFRRFIPPVGMIDLSPIAAFIVLSIIQYWIVLPIVRDVF
ncbi:YggT family protein [Peptococcaceae bacterium]|nr:YggT family protein [Peptococcaceae bacterium]